MKIQESNIQLNSTQEQKYFETTKVSITPIEQKIKPGIKDLPTLSSYQPVKNTLKEYIKKLKIDDFFTFKNDKEYWLEFIHKMLEKLLDKEFSSYFKDSKKLEAIEKMLRDIQKKLKTSHNDRNPVSILISLWNEWK